VIREAALDVSASSRMISTILLPSTAQEGDDARGKDLEVEIGRVGVSVALTV
jgi:hypothetical protein